MTGLHRVLSISFSENANKTMDCWRAMGEWQQGGRRVVRRWWEGNEETCTVDGL